MVYTYDKGYDDGYDYGYNDALDDIKTVVNKLSHWINKTNFYGDDDGDDYCNSYQLLCKIEKLRR